MRSSLKWDLIPSTKFRMIMYDTLAFVLGCTQQQICILEYQYEYTFIDGHFYIYGTIKKRCLVL